MAARLGHPHRADRAARVYGDGCEGPARWAGYHGGGAPARRGGERGLDLWHVWQVQRRDIKGVGRCGESGGGRRGGGAERAGAGDERGPGAEARETRPSRRGQGGGGARGRVCANCTRGKGGISTCQTCAIRLIAYGYKAEDRRATATATATAAWHSPNSDADEATAIGFA